MSSSNAQDFTSNVDLSEGRDTVHLLKLLEKKLMKNMMIIFSKNLLIKIQRHFTKVK